MKEIPLALCLPPHLLVGSEDFWQKLLGQSSTLATYDRLMRRIDEEALRTPACFAILPSRPGDRYETGPQGTLQGVLVVRPGESWSRLFGAAREYVRGLPVNEPLRRRFPDPDLLHPGVEIRYPYHLRRLNQALDEFRAAPPSRIPILRPPPPAPQWLLCPPLVGNGPVLTATLRACPVQWKYEPQEFTTIQYSCTAIRILRSKIKLTLTLDPRTVSAAQPPPKAVLTASHRSGAEPNQAIQLKVGDAEIEVDALGAVSVKTQEGWKTEFEPPESGRFPKLSAPPFKVIVLETRGKPPFGTKDEIELGPWIRPNAFGRIEIGFTYSRVVSLQRFGQSVFSLGIEVEASLEFDPRGSLAGHSCRPYARPLEDLVRRLREQGVIRPDDDIRVVDLGGVTLVVLGIATAAAAAVVLTASPVLAAAARASVLVIVTLASLPKPAVATPLNPPPAASER